MIPQKLTIEGLYSYQERQTIDFTSLMSAGLFGIFGATGSGKSSILEAITFALYGKTERLSLGDNRNYNMLNLKSDRMYIEFDFYNYDNQHYRAVRELKRNSKKFDTVNIPSNHVIFYKIENDVILPLENVDAEKLIGMTYDNFKRTIIIPQGQFKEFLELKPTARTEMLKEIFNLYRFDLQDRVALLISENKSKFDRLEGQIAGYEDISEENITLAATQLTEESKVLEQLQSSHKDLDEKYQRAKQLMSEFELLNNKK
jgi:DNA repair protein SbcC/Rad50